MDSYKRCKAYVNKINEGFGTLTLFSVATAIPYYGNLLPEFLHNQEMSLLDRAIMGFNLFNMSIVLYFTSTFVAQVGFDLQFKYYMNKLNLIH